MKLSEKLNALNSYPFHMPGHKRNTSFSIYGCEMDITEIDGFDNLHTPTALIAEMQTALAEIYGCSKSIISVNGSTCCILAAISAVCSKGDKIIIARNCHKAVYNACLLNELDMIYIEPSFDSRFGMYTCVSQNAVDEAVKAHPDACAVVITSPTYEGFTSEIKCALPLIIDSAHGAHFGMSDFLPKMQYADIVIQSLHKTLPALTQTAVVHINNPAFEDDVKRYMDIYESSSPSYILLASVDRCIDFLKDRETAFSNYFNLLHNFYTQAKKLESIEILKNDDMTRIVLMSKKISGIEFAEKLRKCGIEAEGATINYVILISTVCDTKAGFDLLLNALKKIDAADGAFEPYISRCPVPCKAKARNSSVRTKVSITESIGRTAAEFVYAYPPAIPILAPNEIINRQSVDAILRFCDANVNVISDSGLLPNEILVY